MFKIQDILLRVPNTLSNQECKLLIDYHKKHEKKVDLEHCPEANTGIDTYSSFKRIVLPRDTKVHTLVHKKTRMMVKKWLDHLKKFKAFHVPLLSQRLNYSHMYRLLKYEVGAKIHPHTDFDDYTYASCTFNLNDKYTGGEFKFWNGQYNVTLKKGEGMIWPADYFWIHEVSPIKTGVRYSTNCFIQSVDLDLSQEINKQAYTQATARAATQPQYFW
tara:strand:- start:408 stop:1058 length:651 start_codon:yes stop_codon:yes gene_type:complete